MSQFFFFIYTFTPLRFFIQSFWRDEAFSYLLAKQNILSILILTAKDYNPPLYYLLLHMWIGVFGPSEIALRTLSLLFFFGTLYVVSLFLNNIFKISVKKTLFYLLLFVLNPLLHYYAFEARMYTLFAFFITLSFYYLYKREYQKYVVVAVAGLYTHYFAAFALLGQILFLILTERNKLKKICKMYLAIAISYAPWICFVVASRPPLNNDFWIPRLDIKTVLNIPALLFTGYEYIQSFYYVPLPIISVLLYGIFFVFILRNYKKIHINLHPNKHKKNERLGILMCCWVIAPLLSVILISFIKPVFLPRYTIFITIGLLLTLIYILQTLPSKLLYPLMALLLLFLGHYSFVQVIKRNKANIKRPLLEIKKLMGKDDVIYVTHEFNFHPAQYYLDGKQVYIYGKTYGKIRSYVGKILIPENSISNSLPPYPHRAFILKDDLSYIIQALY